MEDKINLSVVTPSREVVSLEVDEITAPGWDGEFGVLPNHAPFLALIRSGELRYRVGKKEENMAVGFGFVEVLPDKVTVLIETAEKSAEIDVGRATEARDKALADLSGGKDIDFEKVRADLMRAISRLNVAKKHAFGRRRAEQQFKPGRQ